MKKNSTATSDKLGGYLTAIVSIGTLASSAHAAIVNLDVSSISGPNAGVTSGTSASTALSTLAAGLTGSLVSWNTSLLVGLQGTGGAMIAYDDIAGSASPINFTGGGLIDVNAPFTGAEFYSVFRDQGALSEAPDFPVGSYIGFRSANDHYGWLEVTWDSGTGTFEVLSGAYEDQPGVGIQAGAMAAVPEPAAALGTLCLLAGGGLLRRRKQTA